MPIKEYLYTNCFNHIVISPDNQMVSIHVDRFEAEKFCEYCNGNIGLGHDVKAIVLRNFTVDTNV